MSISEQPETDSAASAKRGEDLNEVELQSEYGNQEAPPSQGEPLQAASDKNSSATVHSQSVDNNGFIEPENDTENGEDKPEGANEQPYEPLNDPKVLESLQKVAGEQITEIDGFMAAAILPGESRQQFEELLAGVFQELRLDGPLERHLGLLITSYFWRLNNLEIFHVAQRARAKYGRFFRKGPGAALFGIVGRIMADALVKVETSKIEKQGFKDIAEWLNRVWTTATNNESLPDVQESLPFPVDCMLTPKQMAVFCSGSEESDQVGIDIDLAECGDLITTDRFREELQVHNELVGGIAKCLKLIGQIKGMKKKFDLGSAQTPRPQIIIKSGGSPEWGRVRLITTKRRR